MNKTDQASAPTRVAMTLDDQMHALAAGLRDVIQETSESYLKEDPENAYVDLACRLVLRLRETLTVVPTEQVALARAQSGRTDAAFRTLDIFTRWMREHPECSYSTEIGVSGKFELTIQTRRLTRGDETQGFFQDESVQDAYAQAAQVIDFNGGTL